MKNFLLFDVALFPSRVMCPPAPHGGDGVIDRKIDAKVLLSLFNVDRAGIEPAIHRISLPWLHPSKFPSLQRTASFSSVTHLRHTPHRIRQWSMKNFVLLFLCVAYTEASFIL